MVKKKFSLAIILMALSIGVAGCGGTHRAERKAAKAEEEAAGAQQEAAEEEPEVVLDAGDYELYSIEVSGMNLDIETLKMAGLLPENNYISLADDYTGKMCFEGSVTDFKWEPGSIMIGKETVKYSIEEGRLSAEFSDALLGGSLGDDAIITYILKDEAQTAENAPEEEAAPAVDAAVLELANTYEGDWIGALKFEKAGGKFSDLSGKEINAAGRFSFDEEGNCTASLAADLAGAEKDGFGPVTLEIDQEAGTAFLNGELMGVPFQYATITMEEGKPCLIHIFLEDSMDTAEINIALRRNADEWQGDEAPMINEEFKGAQSGSSYDKIAVDMGVDETTIPEATNIRGI